MVHHPHYACLMEKQAISGMGIFTECSIISPSSVDVICYSDCLDGDTRRERLYKPPAICLSLLFCSFSSVTWDVALA